MKRKRTETHDSTSPTKREAKVVEAPKENDLKLSSVCTISSPNELTSQFCLLAANDHIILRTKIGFEILKFESSARNDHTKFQMTSSKFPCSSYEVGLKVNQKRLFNASSHQQKQDIMLSQTMFPDCVLKKIQVKKTQLVPFSPKLPDIVASLTTRGSLELSEYKFDSESQENILEKIEEVCEIRKKSFDLSGSYSRFEKLQEILKELMFYCFDWCPVTTSTSRHRHLAAVTKSSELLLYSIDQDHKVKVMQSEKISAVISEVKWIFTENSHKLLLGTSTGNVIRFDIEVIDDTLTKLTKTDEIQGNLKVPISWIEPVFSSNVFICTKSHSVEIFAHNKNGFESSIKYIGCSISGITRIHPNQPEFLLVTLNNKIFYMKLSSTGKVQEFEQVDNITSQELKQSLYCAYGITASKNKALIFVALYPSQSFDHLVNKQPASIAVNVFPKVDPSLTLMENKSLKLTEFSDCIEAVRFMGSARLESVRDLEKMSYEVKMDQKFLYYLKLQLIVRRAKAAHYQPRSHFALHSVKKDEAAIKKLIEAMNSFFLLKSINVSKKSTNETKMVIRSLVNYLKAFIEDENLHDEFKEAQESLKPEITNLLGKCKVSSSLKAETCQLCDKTIAQDKLICELKHESVRCAITKLQLPVSSTNVCINCDCLVSELEVLKRISGDEQLCPFCDWQLL